MKKGFMLLGLLAATATTLVGANQIAANKAEDIQAPISAKRAVALRDDVVEDTVNDVPTEFERDQREIDGELILPIRRRLISQRFTYTDLDGVVIPMREIKATYKLSYLTTAGGTAIERTGTKQLTDNGVLTVVGASYDRDYTLEITLSTETSAIKTVDLNGNVFKKTLVRKALSLMKIDDTDHEFNYQMSESFVKAVSMFEAGLTASKLVKHLNNDTDIRQCTIRWFNNQNGGAYYSSNTITLRSASFNGITEYTAWDVIGHEYGHHVQSVFNLSRNPAGTHYINSNMSDQYYTNTSVFGTNTVTQARDKGIRIAYAEGWATAYSLYAQDYDRAFCEGIRTCADDRYTANNGNIDISYGDYSCKKGEASEDSVIAFLWNLHDAYDCEKDPFDYFELPFEEIWEISQGVYTFSDFVGKLYNYSYDYEEIAYLLDEIKVVPCNIRIASDYYKDAPVTFSWDNGGGSRYFYNNEFVFKFVNSRGEPYYSKKVVVADDETPSVTIDLDTWQRMQQIFNGQIIVCVEGFVNRGGIVTGGYTSLQEYLWQPSASVNDSERTTITPANWAFNQTYTTEETSKDLTIDVFDYITSRRLRTGNNGGYTVMSPKKNGFGEAYFMLEFHRYVNSADVQLAEWSRDEGIGDCQVIIETMDCEKSWTVSNVIDVRSMNTKEEGLIEYTTGIKEPIYGICISIKSNATGTKNKGRICIGNISLNY